MSIEALLVGYRPGNRRIHELRDKYGIEHVQVRRCIGGCGYPVYFTDSGLATARGKDCEVICDICMEENRAEIEAAL